MVKSNSDLTESKWCGGGGGKGSEIRKFHSDRIHIMGEGLMIRIFESEFPNVGEEIGGLIGKKKMLERESRIRYEFSARKKAELYQFITDEFVGICKHSGQQTF